MTLPNDQQSQSIPREPAFVGRKPSMHTPTRPHNAHPPPLGNPVVLAISASVVLVSVLVVHTVAYDVYLHECVNTCISPPVHEQEHGNTLCHILSRCCPVLPTSICSPTSKQSKPSPTFPEIIDQPYDQHEMQRLQPRNNTSCAIRMQGARFSCVKPASPSSPALPEANSARRRSYLLRRKPL